MAFQLPPLPYAYNALEPKISEETLRFHHDKHHQTYVDKLNGLVADTDLADATLETLIQTTDGPIFNNAAQVWNHTFYWNCLSAEHNLQPSEAFRAQLIKHFGSVESFMTQFTQVAANTFGSGWAWLVKDAQQTLSLVSTSNAGNPLTEGLTPILTCDVWEHAYYIDTRNDRMKYLNNFWPLVNWPFVEACFNAA